MSTFTGFSEDDLKRIQSGEVASDDQFTTLNKKPKFITSSKKKAYQYKSVNLQNQKIDDAIDDIKFDKCRLSIRTSADDEMIGKMKTEDNNISAIKNVPNDDDNEKENIINNNSVENSNVSENYTNTNIEVKDTNVNKTPCVVRGVEYAEDDLASHRAKLEELQLQQKIMEEQNKKRKEMLAKALADRTRQTEEEVMKLEKIKKELQVLDGQFSQDVGVLRKKIDLACVTYSEAEKHYLKVEKEFLHAKIQLQKEKEKKELLTEHLCALITHNETRKAHKLETLMLELSTHKTTEIVSEAVDEPKVDKNGQSPIIVDGVDQRTGKMVEINGS